MRFHRHILLEDPAPLQGLEGCTLYGMPSEVRVLLFIISSFLGWVPLLFYSNAGRASLLYGFLTPGLIVQRSTELLLKHVPALARYSDQCLEIELITTLGLMLTYYLIWKHQTGRSNRAR
jgi:hypothetical protein